MIHLTRVCLAQINLPPDWTSYIHPSGWKYYYNPTLRLVTDFTLDVKVGQEEFDRAIQLEIEQARGVGAPVGWEKWIDTGKNCVGSFESESDKNSFRYYWERKDVHPSWTP
jgi:hypothetical protein